MRASMMFSDEESEPTSVFSGAGGTRWLKSPAAIWAAVFSMRFSGCNVRRMMSADSDPPSSTMAMPTVMQYWVRVLMMSIWSDSDKPMNTTPLTVSLPLLSASTHLNAATRHGARAACNTPLPTATCFPFVVASVPSAPLSRSLFGSVPVPPSTELFATARSTAFVVNGLPYMSSVSWSSVGSFGMETIDAPVSPATDGTRGVLTLPVNSPFSTYRTCRK